MDEEPEDREPKDRDRFAGLRSPKRLLLLLVAVAVIGFGVALASRSTSDEPPGADAAEPSPGSTSSIPPTSPTSSPDATVPAESGMARLEQAWDEQRQLLIAELTEGIDAGRYGVQPDGVLLGPGGLVVDLNTCPDQWADTDGVGATIRIGHPSPQSGVVSDFSQLTDGLEAYYEQVNERYGGVGDRPLELMIRDDGYTPERTETVTRELIDSEEPPFIVLTIGTPGSLRVYEELNTRCVPQPFVASGHPAWGDPLNHPWTSSLQMSQTTEALLWGAYLERNRAADLPVDVAALVMDNSFGWAYEDAFTEYAAQHPEVVRTFVPVRHNPASPTVGSEMELLAAGDPDVVLAMTAGQPCLLAVAEAGRLELNTSALALFLPLSCRDEATYLIPAGEAASGWLSLGDGIRSPFDPRVADGPFSRFTIESLADRRGAAPTTALQATGFAQYGWLTVEVLRIADALPGGLTRTNLLLTIRGVDLVHPLQPEGFSLTMNGVDDAHLVEGAEFLSFDLATETWLVHDEGFDLRGATPNCAWSTDTQRCGG